MPFKRTHHDDHWAFGEPPEPPREDAGINKSTAGVLLALTLLVPIVGPLATICTCAMRTHTARSRLLLILANIMLFLQIVGLLYFTPWVLKQFGVDDPETVAHDSTMLPDVLNA